MDVFATLVLLFVVSVQTYTLFDKVSTTYGANVQTFDMRIPVWPFFAIAWVGDLAAVLLIAVRTYRLIFHPDDKPATKFRSRASERFRLPLTRCLNRVRSRSRDADARPMAWRWASAAPLWLSLTSMTPR